MTKLDSHDPGPGCDQPARVVVTGAAGFIGSHVVDSLLAAGHDVTAVVRPRDNGHPSPPRPRLDCIACDLAQLAADPLQAAVLTDQLRERSPVILCHLGWLGTAPQCRDRASQETNVALTRVLARTATDVGCEQVVAAGSQAEYGVLDEPVDESRDVRPVTAYGRAKAAAYEVWREGFHGPFAWLRLFAVYGPRDRPHSFLPAVLTTLFSGKTMRLTAGGQRWDYLYAADAAAAVTAVISGRLSVTANVGSGVAMPVREVVSLLDGILRARGWRDPAAVLCWGAIPYPAIQTMRLQSASALLTDLTGWQPSVDLSTGLGRTASWFAAERGLRP